MKLKNTKLRQGDEVIVVSGREKGKRGNIKKIVGDKNKFYTLGEKLYIEEDIEIEFKNYTWPIKDISL